MLKRYLLVKWKLGLGWVELSFPSPKTDLCVLYYHRWLPLHIREQIPVKSTKVALIKWQNCTLTHLWFTHRHDLSNRRLMAIINTGMDGPLTWFAFVASITQALPAGQLTERALSCHCSGMETNDHNVTNVSQGCPCGYFILYWSSDKPLLLHKREIE